ncbi:hypothetical protein BDQ17DRAFT_1362258 [Cyathus striatus]|nr:hypothetical protein BDQ17DRAFT_1362258 [Cyathus striatus]
MFAPLTGFTSTMLLLATCAATVNAALNFTDASWIWSSEAAAVSKPINVPVAHRAFRKDFSTGLLKLPTSVEVIMTADDAYTLYINGAQVGSGNDWRTTQYFCVRTTAADIETIFGNRVVIAVDGLIASVKINYLGGGSDQFVTDASWDVNLDDSSWTPSVVEKLMAEGIGVVLRRHPIRLVPLRKNIPDSDYLM